MTFLELEPTGVAAGGDALARDAGGRVAFVEGALPGERVGAEVVQERKDFVRARVIEVLDPSPSRVEPPCPFVAAGCGGCQWQHIDPAAQSRLKVDIVIDALRRIAHRPDPPMAGEVRAVPATAYRTTLRLAVGRDGRAAYHRRHGHDLVAVDSCLIAHPALEDLVVNGRFPRAREVTLRVSASTGERVAVVHPAGAGLHVPADVAAGGRIHEELAGRRWRISATSFFQAGPAGAELLVDAYAGVGLLGGALAGGRGNVAVVAIESHPAAARDAKANLADLDARVLQIDVGEWRAPDEPPALVVADPARTGLGKPGVQALVAAGAPVLVLVSCDPASLARDTALLAGAGYRLASVQVLDLFPHTFHVETVSRFERAAPSRS